MKKEYRRYLRYGKHVSYRGESYRVVQYHLGDYIGDIDGSSVLCVREKDYERYLRLKNGIWKTADSYKASASKREILEKEGYEKQLPMAGIQSTEKIRFISSRYQDLFSVPDFGKISVNGTVCTVTSLDPTHFHFIDGMSDAFYGGCFHICQFAEICEQNGISVMPCGEEAA